MMLVNTGKSPDSNPLVTEDRKYSGIGKALIAFGIKLSVEHGFGGDVILEPKTEELKSHYIKDFNGVVLPNYSGDVPCSILIADLAAVDIITDYICQGDDNE